MHSIWLWRDKLKQFVVPRVLQRDHVSRMMVNIHKSIREIMSLYSPLVQLLSHMHGRKNVKWSMMGNQKLNKETSM